MKLIYCRECGDVISLTSKEQSCRCGKARGAYTDTRNAWYSGKAVPLGFDNPDFFATIDNQPTQGMSKFFNAFVVPENCATFKKRENVFPCELTAVAECGQELEAATELIERLHVAIMLKKKLLADAARVANATDMREHAKLLAVLQLTLPIAYPEDWTPEQLAALVYTLRLIGEPEIEREASVQAGRLLRGSGLHVLNIAMRNERAPDAGD